MKLLCTLGIHRWNKIAWGIPKFSQHWMIINQCKRCKKLHKSWNLNISYKIRSSHLMYNTPDFNLLEEEIRSELLKGYSTRYCG